MTATLLCGTLSEDDIVTITSTCTPSPTNTSASSSSTNTTRPYLGGEPVMFGEENERAGVIEILRNLSVEEKEQMKDPSMPIRHFRAEKGDTKKAIRKLRNTLEWRKSFGVDRIVQAFETGDKEMQNILQEEHATGKIYARGFDKEGRALMYMRPGRENTHNEENNMRNLVFNLEKSIACTRRKSLELGAPVPLEKIKLVIDYIGFKLKNSPPMSTSRRTLDILQSHYPERMAVAYVCNPPLVFRTFWSVIKPFVDATTKEKVVFCHGKSGLKKLAATVSDTKLEPCAGGDDDIREFDSKEYLAVPFHTSFGE